MAIIYLKASPQMVRDGYIISHIPNLSYSEAFTQIVMVLSNNGQQVLCYTLAVYKRDPYKIQVLACAALSVRFQFRGDIRPSRVPRGPTVREDDDPEALCAETQDARPDSYVNTTASVLLSDGFRNQTIAGYTDDKKWGPLLRQLTLPSNDEPREKVPYSVDDGLLYSTQEDGSRWLCLPRSITNEVFRFL